MTSVENGRLAVERARAERFDLILMDVEMPEMNGLEATAAIRAEEGEGERTPIIALTAEARTGDRERCLAGGSLSDLGGGSAGALSLVLCL